MAILALLALSLLRTYSSLPARELKHRARHGDKTAKIQYRAAAYGTSLRAFLWLIIGLASGGFFVLVSLSAPWWFALSSSAVLLWVGFVWLPGRRVTRVSNWLATKLAPMLAWLLTYLHPIIDWLRIKLGRSKRSHTGLYDIQDLQELMKQQQQQSDNRIDKAELEIATHALGFGQTLVRQVMVPRRVVVSVKATDAVGPVLMGELHDSGHSRFPVFEDKDKAVGTLYLHDLLNAKESGSVSKIMRRDACYVHEEQSLHDALQAILKTHHHLLIVVNSFEEYVGIITMEDVLEQIIGKPIMDEFDKYEDLRAVAERAAKTEHHEHDDKPAEDSKDSTSEHSVVE